MRSRSSLDPQVLLDRPGDVAPPLLLTKYARSFTDNAFIPVHSMAPVHLFGDQLRLPSDNTCCTSDRQDD
jgi:hypothetical protein